MKIECQPKIADVSVKFSSNTGYLHFLRLVNANKDSNDLIHTSGRVNTVVLPESLFKKIIN